MLALIHDVSQRRQMSLILCSHLLRDVERVCESVIVFNQGKVAARGPIAELTGPAALRLRRAREGRRGRRSSPTSRTRAATGARARTATACSWPTASGPSCIFRTARECGVQVRYLRPGAESLEDVFLRALGHEVQA